MEKNKMGKERMSYGYGFTLWLDGQSSAHWENIFTEQRSSEGRKTTNTQIT